MDDLEDWQDLDVFLFDYGGVIAFHYCEPWQGNLAKLLQCEPKRVRELLSESSEQGRGYRVGKMSREAFWKEVMNLAEISSVDVSELEKNWACSYQIDQRMFNLISQLRRNGKRVGVLMNTDLYRYTHIEQEYKLSEKVDFMISSCQHGVVKPDTEAYLLALKIAGCENTPEKIVYVDDREQNVHPCLEIGMKGVVFTDFDSFQDLLIRKKILPSL